MIKPLVLWYNLLVRTIRVATCFPEPKILTNTDRRIRFTLIYSNRRLQGDGRLSLVWPLVHLIGDFAVCRLVCTSAVELNNRSMPALDGEQDDMAFIQLQKRFTGSRVEICWM